MHPHAPLIIIAVLLLVGFAHLLAKACAGDRRMTTLEWLAIGFGVWLIVAFACAIPLGRHFKRLNRQFDDGAF